MYLLRKQRGLTLVEMMIVIVVMGTLIFVSFYYPDEKVRLDAEAQQLASDLRYVQFLAMTQNSKFRVTFAADHYSLSDSNNVAYKWPLTGASSVTMDQHFQLTWVSLVLPNNYLIFDGQGIPYSSATTKLSNSAIITLQYGNLTKAITITPDTGKVSGP